MIYSHLPEWKLNNKRVFLRADLNVPLEQGTITNDFRLKSILPTLNFILEQNGSVVLATHIGRPKEYDKNLSTQLLIEWFERNNYSIIFLADLSKIYLRPFIPKQIILLENLRFFPGEKNGSPFFAKQLAQTADYYVNDAFGVVHHNDCSVTLLPYEFPENRRTIGFLLEKELRMLDTIRDNPQRPFIALIGGGKITDKISFLDGLLDIVDTLIICPATCFSFLKALAKPVGLSLIDDTIGETCKKILRKADNQNKEIIFPIDYQIAQKSVNGELSITSAELFPHDAVGISIGPETIKIVCGEIDKAKTIFFNCAMGFANRPETLTGTKIILQAMARTQAITMVAGGESIKTAYDAGVATDINYLSIGGGAALAYLGGNLLPGLVAFEEK